jgi:hypothetical protein
MRGAEIVFLGLCSPDPQQAQPALSMLRIASAFVEKSSALFHKR